MHLNMMEHLDSSNRPRGWHHFNLRLWLSSPTTCSTNGSKPFSWACRIYWDHLLAPVGPVGREKNSILTRFNFFSSIIVKLGDLAQWQRLGGLHVSEGGISREMTPDDVLSPPCYSTTGLNHPDFFFSNSYMHALERNARDFSVLEVGSSNPGCYRHIDYKWTPRRVTQPVIHDPRRRRDPWPPDLRHQTSDTRHHGRCTLCSLCLPGNGWIICGYNYHSRDSLRI
jgi:hypothetical protein